MINNQRINTSDISIILLLYNTPKNKIKNLLNYKDFKIYILDQSNDQITKKKICKLLPNIKYYKVSTKNIGFAGGINFLIKKIKTKFFLCTQIDVLIKKKSIIEMSKAFVKKKDCIISVPIFKRLKKKNSLKMISKINNFIGAIFLAEKNRFNKLGNFDEDFFFYWEDQDLSKRIEISKKFNIYQCERSFAKHMNGNSTKMSNRSKYIRISNFKFGEYLFQQKYQKLKFIKIIRDPIVRILLVIIFFILFKKNLAFQNLYHLFGIFKFYKYKICKKFN